MAFMVQSEGYLLSYIFYVIYQAAVHNFRLGYTVARRFSLMLLEKSTHTKRKTWTSVAFD
jgi:hypothetical protein